MLNPIFDVHLLAKSDIDDMFEHDRLLAMSQVPASMSEAFAKRAEAYRKQKANRPKPKPAPLRVVVEHRYGEEPCPNV